ncbi:MAG: T9SS type A sorting domain-containing protein [Saprospiraceae bacterium]
MLTLNQFHESCRKLRTCRTAPVMLIYFLILTGNMIAQSVLHKISYFENLTSNYALSNDVDPGSVHDFDLLNARPVHVLAHVATTVDNEGYVTVDRSIQADPAIMKTYTEPARTLSNRDGVSLYDQDGRLMQFTPFGEGEAPVRIDPTAINLSEMGYSPRIEKMNEIQIASWISEGYVITEQSDYRTVISNGDRRITYDVKGQSILTENFENNTKSSSTLEKYFTLPNGKNILTLSVHKYYKPLRHSGMMEVTMRTEYSDYVINGTRIIIEDAFTSQLSSGATGQSSLTSFDFHDLDYRHILSVYPVPSSDIINYHVDADNEQFPCRYAIYDMTGAQVMKGICEASAGQILISSLSSGSYQLVITNNQSTHHARIIKN